MKKLTPSLAGIYIFLVIVGFISAFPFYFIVVSATNPSVEVIRGRMFFGNYFISNFENLVKTIPIGMGFLNSVRNALV
ncbi:MAG: carbohydrate ABC transporter permease, partial [Treponema sp.]|nr:carbohydrate ABC transporter permease [Treponema sp.]